jgi:trk system potassium uptake protein TrkA
MARVNHPLVEEKVHPAALAMHQAIRDLDLPQACILTAIIRRGELIIPRGEVVLQPADEVLAVVHASQKSRLAAILGAVQSPL